MKIDGHAFVLNTPEAVEDGQYAVLLTDGTADGVVVLAQEGDGQRILLRHTLDNQGALGVTLPSPQAGTTQAWQVFTADISGTLILEGSFTLTAPDAPAVPDPTLFVITWMKFWEIVEATWNGLVRTYRAWKVRIGTVIAVLFFISVVGGCVYGMWEGIRWAIGEDNSSEPTKSSQESPATQEVDAGSPSTEDDTDLATQDADSTSESWWEPPQGTTGQWVGLAMVKRNQKYDTPGWHVYAIKKDGALACRKDVPATLRPTAVYLVMCPP